MTDLNSLLPANSGWILSNATGINDSGQIVGVGTYNGQTQAFLLDTSAPEPGTIALMIGGAGLIFAMRKRLLPR
jgi:hypothetical protein